VTLPNFLIIGAHKGASSSLRIYLGEHPDVFVAPVGEPSFFALEGQARFRPDGTFTRPGMVSAGATYTREEYEALFAGVTSERAVGEKSPAYLTNRDAPFRIKHLIPDVRLIAVLRNPVERAYSHYLMNVRSGQECLTFADAVAAERHRQPMGAGLVRHYVRSGIYAERIELYRSLFGPEQFRIYLYEDLVRDMSAIMRELYEYVGVDPAFTPDLTVRYNARPADNHNGRLRSRLCSLGRTMTNREMAPTVSNGIPLATRKELLSFYHEDVVRLQALIDRDLTGWLV
jgi:hypothetical protein